MTSSSGDYAACPNDPVVFTCVVDGPFIQWRMNPPPNYAVTMGITRIVAIDDPDSLQDFGPEGFMFQAAVTATSSDSITSTLTTLTEVSLLNGTTVSCVASQSESLTIIVASELISTPHVYFAH